MSRRGTGAPAVGSTPVETGAPPAPVSDPSNAGVSPSAPESLEQKSAKPKNAMRPEEAAASAIPTRDVPKLADRQPSTPSGGDPHRPIAPQEGRPRRQDAPAGAPGDVDAHPLERVGIVGDAELFDRDHPADRLEDDLDQRMAAQLAVEGVELRPRFCPDGRGQ